jgi:hypothetical protein
MYIYVISPPPNYMQWQQEFKYFYSHSPPAAIKCPYTVVGSSVLHPVAGPCQAVQWQQELK